MEMPGPWKAWKTKIRFPTFPRGACDDDRGLSVFRTKNQERRSARFAASSITFFRIHARLETELCFRIILRLENALGTPETRKWGLRPRRLDQPEGRLQ